MILIGIGVLTQRRFVHQKKYPIYLGLAFFCIIAMIHVAVTGALNNGNFFSYLSDCYGAKYTAGGLLVGIFTFPFMSFLNPVAAYVFFSIVLVVLISLIIEYLYAVRQFAVLSHNNTRVEKEEPNIDVIVPYFEGTQTKSAPPPEEEEPAPAETFKQGSRARDILGLNKTEQAESAAQPRQRLYDSEPKPNPVASIPQPSEQWMNRSMGKNPTETADIRPPKYVHDPNNVIGRPESIMDIRNREYLQSIHKVVPENVVPIINAETVGSRIEPLQNRNINVVPQPITPIPPISQSIQQSSTVPIEPQPIIPNPIISNVDNLAPKLSPLNPNNFKTGDDKSSFDEGKSIISSVEDFSQPKENVAEKFNIPQGMKRQQEMSVQISIPGTEREKTAKAQPAPKYKRVSRYNRPPVEMLNVITHDISGYEHQQQQNIEKLEEVLNKFGIAAKVIAVRRGPAVTRYEVSIPMGVGVKKLINHNLDISMALAARGEIRIEAPIPGKSAVGIEVPNNGIDAVGLRDIVDTEKFRSAHSPLSFAVGKDIDGTVYVGDIAKMPHLLVAGATGSGKSVALNSMLISLLYKASPEDLKLIIVDPKRVEFTLFNGLPHMLIPNSITDTNKAINALNWLINEMERRYELFQNCYVKNIHEYNSQSQVVSGQSDKLPFIVLIVDEFGDLMAGPHRRDFEDQIIKLTQKARAAGIHIILATQRPSVDVITGTIKINLPSRMAFAVNTFEDSRTILGCGGADKLLGRGDMLYMASSSPAPIRLQGAFVDTPEIAAIIKYVKEHNETHFDEELEVQITSNPDTGDKGEASAGGGNTGGVDALMQDALKLVIDSGNASVSMLQRRFSIGFNRAARIVDQMEEAGFVGPQDGSKSRKVYITMEHFNELFGSKE
ncbi:MAG: DNA translocase FtsK [Christensenellaceae bacterium]|nr:DNA translocase FtsK [Christensenellaceae bacterium]